MINRWTLGVLAVLAPIPLLLAQAPGPSATIQLGSREGRAAPTRTGFNHTGGGNIDVAQPTPDSIVVTLTGVAVAGPHPCKDSLASLTFDVQQSFKVSCDDPKKKRARLSLEGRVIGLLRSHDREGCAEQSPAYAALTCVGPSLLDITLPAHAVANGENVSINDRQGPASAVIEAGEYHLHQSFAVRASHPHSFRLSKAASAEFAPDPALDPLWISHWEPFHGANKKDFGFQVTVRVAPE